jgi:hypothetical protein
VGKSFWHIACCYQYKYIKYPAKNMNALIKLFSLILVFTLIQCGASAQTLTIVRTDIDSARADFVTVSYVFGFDIITESVDSCSRIFFNVKLNSTNYIKYSGYLTPYGGDSSTVIVNPEIDTLTNEGNIFVGGFFESMSHPFGFTNPKVVHFDFVATQNVPNGTQFTLSITDAKAVIIKDGSELQISIPSLQQTYTVHSYVDVWPGDADNNGIVDNNDFMQIGLLLSKNASSSKLNKCFKREPASAIWKAQTSLEWDKPEYTFADCNGDGEITISDMLVVFLNYKSQHGIVAKSDNYNPETKNSNKKTLNDPKIVYIPIKAGFAGDYIGAVARISWKDLPEYAKVVGIETGSLFDPIDSYSYGDFHYDEKYVDFAVGNLNPENTIKSAGVLAWLVVDQGIELIDKMVIPEQISGINRNGQQFSIPCLVQSGIDDPNLTNDINISYTDNGIIFTFPFKVSDDNNVHLYDMNGNQINIDKSLTVIDDQGIYLQTSDFSTGLYLLTGLNRYNHTSWTRKIVITK